MTRTQSAFLRLKIKSDACYAIENHVTARTIYGIRNSREQNTWNKPQHAKFRYLAYSILPLRYPTRSLRTAEQDSSIPQSTIHQILRQKIRMFPYKTQSVQELRSADYVPWLEFAPTVMLNLRSEANFLNRTIFPGECVFHMSGKVNTQNGLI